MTSRDINARPVKKEFDLSPKEKNKRKQRVLTQGTPSITHSIADALVVKNGNLIFLTQTSGDVPLSENHGYGLYYHDCRFLDGYEIKIAQASPTVLVSGAATGFSSIIELTNPEIMVGQGEHIDRDILGIKWERILDSDKNALFDTLTIQNYSLDEVAFPISLTFQAHFEDIFSIRGLLQVQPGKLFPPTWRENGLVFEYVGADDLWRPLSIHFSPPPTVIADTTVTYFLHCRPRESQRILVYLHVFESEQKPDLNSLDAEEVHFQTTFEAFQQISQAWLKDQMEMDCQRIPAKNIVERSLIDLRTLRSSLDHAKYFAAGVPWFATLFGRDSIISALQMLGFNHQIAAETLRLLAEYQAEETNPWQDAQPGKILHEIRVGELAHLQEIPHTPYYGTVDATELFLILVARASAWMGNLELFNELRPNIEAALRWIDRFGDSDGDGYIDYQSASEGGLVNQGWKDSGNAVINADGSLASPPIALPEVQGYVYRAKMGIADLFEKEGEFSRAEQLRQQADILKAHFNRDFWSDPLGTYVLALQAGGKQAEVVSSNAGQVLWTGIADREKAQKTVNRLMADDMYNGWGIRTLSSQAKSYNPIGYHLGTVWPFDNALIAAGFRRYGYDEQALKLFLSLIEAAVQFQEYRLPELFAGFERARYWVPVHYPVACHPQAWSAGSIPYLLTVLLGLVPDAFARRLFIVRPLLPDVIGPIEIHRLVVGDAQVDLSFEPSDQGYAAVRIQKVTGKLDIEVVSDQREYDF